MMILTEEEKNRIVTTVAKGNLSCGPVVSSVTENSSVPPYQSSETQLSKEAMDSPAKKQHKNKVKLAANFSLAPVTKL